METAIAGANRRAKGRKRFLDQNPQVKRNVESLTQEQADILGISLEWLQEAKTMEAISEYARTIGEDSHEVFLSCIADTVSEFTAMKEAHLTVIANAIR